MEHEGLYRIPADQKKRMELLRHFDRFYNCGKTFSLSDLGPAPNTLAGAVQWFLSSKNLPEPVIPTELIPRLQEVMGEFSNTQVIGNEATLSLAISPKCIGSEMRMKNSAGEEYFFVDVLKCLFCEGAISLPIKPILRNTEKACKITP